MNPAVGQAVHRQIEIEREILQRPIEHRRELCDTLRIVSFRSEMSGLKEEASALQRAIGFILGTDGAAGTRC